MKFMDLLLGFVSQQGRAMFQQNAESVTRNITNNTRKIATLLALTVIFITLFCGFQ